MAKPSTLVHSILSRISMACSSSVSCSRITGEATNGAPSNDTVRWEAISVVILVIHHLPNRIFHRMPRLLVVEGPGHPTLQIGPRFLLGGLDRIQIAKRWRGVTIGIKWRIERLRWNCSGPA